MSGTQKRYFASKHAGQYVVCFFGVVGEKPKTSSAEFASLRATVGCHLPARLATVGCHLPARQNASVE
jgi:hypothetical protein